MSVFATGGGIAPSMGKCLSDYAEGDVVLLNESGSPVEFYVAKHDYESGLNGAGRTLLVRKTGHSSRVWDADKSAKTFPSSDLYAWLNGTYKALLDASVQAAIGTTKYYNLSAEAASKVEEESAVFTYSNVEIDPSVSAMGTGSLLPNAETLKGHEVTWTRVPCVYPDDGFALDGMAFIVSPSITGDAAGDHVLLYFVRPCFTLPANTKFDPDTNQFKGA